jgi:hypothetical protein
MTPLPRHCRQRLARGLATTRKCFNYLKTQALPLPFPTRCQTAGNEFGNGGQNGANYLKINANFCCQTARQRLFSNH